MKQYPIYNPKSESFVSQEHITPWEVPDKHGTPYLTSALKVNRKIDLIGLSMSEVKLKSGESQLNDCLKPDIRVEQILGCVTSGPLRQTVPIVSLFEEEEVLFKCKENQRWSDTYLNFQKNFGLEVKDYVVVVSLNLAGVANIETGVIEITTAKFSFVSAHDAVTMQNVDQQTEKYLKQYLETGEVVGIVLSFETRQW